MASINRVVLVGNLTRDPEIRYTTAGKAVARLGLAVNRVPYTNDQGERVEGVDFFTVVVFDKQAENCGQYLKKGRGIAVDGRLRSRSWETPEGQKRSTVEVVAQTVQFLPRSGEAVEMPPDSGPDTVNLDLPPIEAGGDDLAW